MTNSSLPPGLEDFGRRLDQLGVDDDRLAARQRRRAPVRLRSVAGAAVAAALAAAVAAGATAVISRDGTTIPSEPSTGDSDPPFDPSVVAATRVADPGGGLPWILRIFTNPQGQECVFVGRLKHGVFGEVHNGQFRPLPARTPALCANTAEDGLVAFLDRRFDPPRTAVYGVSPSRAPLLIAVGAGPARRVSPTVLGAFLVVTEGAGPTVKATVRGKVGDSAVVRRLG